MTEEEIRIENERCYKQHKVLQLPMENLVGSGEVKALNRPAKSSHKGQNGKLLIIGGSTLFHGASLWALKVASRIVDMVFYASVPENIEVLKQIKGEVLDFIAIQREQIEDYINEADTILIGPGMVRPKDGITNYELRITNLKEIDNISDEGEQTKTITEHLMKKYPEKRWVVDAGAIQVLDPLWIPKKAILTPHLKEFEQLISKIPNNKFQLPNNFSNSNLQMTELIKRFAKEYHCIVLLKGERDIISDGKTVKYAVGGNPGMTKGGTGDVLAGLVAAFACKNEPFLAARAGSFLNKLAGDMLYKKNNIMFNASDLCEMIPEVYRWCLEI